MAQMTEAVEYTDCISPNESPKQSDGDIPVVQKLWGMQSIPSLPSLPGPIWSGVVGPDRFLSMG